MGFFDADEDIEKGYSKTVIVPAANGRQGYQYIRNYDGIEGKQNCYRGKRTVAYDLYCGHITEALKNGKSFFIKNNSGEFIEITRGSYTKSEGLRHIIKRRVTEYTRNKPITRKEKLHLINEISHVLCIITDNLKNCELKRDINGNYFVKKDGVKAIVTKNGNHKWLLTGYILDDERKITEGVIAARSAGNNYSPSFLGMYGCVGASVTDIILTSLQDKSSRTEKSFKEQLYEITGVVIR